MTDLTRRVADGAPRHGGTARSATGPVLKVDALSVRLPARHGSSTTRRSTRDTQILEAVGFEIEGGETLGLVGESGSGKTTLARALLQLLPRGAKVDGDIVFRGLNLAQLSKREMRPVRRHVQMVFQDPHGSLNPRMTIGENVAEPLKIYRCGSTRDRVDRVNELLGAVGLDASMRERFPYGFSGGQLQRVAIARALALSPDLLICDEPVTALDVSIRAQILNLLCELQATLGLSYLFVAHDLEVVRHMSDRVIVMYLGSIVEVGTSTDLYERPVHPYTQSLLSSIPRAMPGHTRAPRSLLIRGDIASSDRDQSGCAFAPRCWLYRQLGAPEICRTDRPILCTTFKSTHKVACHFGQESIEVAATMAAAASDRGLTC